MGSLRFAQSSRRLKIQALEEVKETKTPVQNLVTILPHLLVKVDQKIEVLNRHEAHHLKILVARKIVHRSLDSLRLHHHKIQVVREIVLLSLDSLLHHHRTQVVPATDRQIQLEAHHHKTVA